MGGHQSHTITINVQPRSPSSNEEEGVNFKEPSVLLTFATMLLQAVAGLGVMGTGLWIILVTRKIQEITGDRLRGPLICVILLSTIQLSEVFIEIAAFVWRLLCLVISMYSLKVSLILCFLITGLNIYLEQGKIVDDSSLKFNRIDSDVIQSLENDFKCDLSMWTLEHGSNSSVLLDCEMVVELWMNQAVRISLICIGGNIVSIVVALTVALTFHNKHHWKQIRTNRIFPHNYRHSMEGNLIDDYIL